MKVIDNFLSPSYFGLIKTVITSHKIEWSYAGNITEPGKDDESDERLEKHGFQYYATNSDQPNSFFSGFPSLITIGMVYSVMDLLECDSIIRVRYDMTLNSPNKVMHDPHVDFPFPHKVGIFYVTDSDAETIIYKEKYDGGSTVRNPKDLTIDHVIYPKENRLLIFDGEYFHTGHSPKEYKNRILINCCFTKENL